MTKLLLEIKPTDTLLFGDGMPFQKKESNYIVSKSSPFPSVIYGAVCTSLMECGKLESVKKLIEGAETLGEIEKAKETEKIDEKLEECLKMTNLYMKKADELYIPAPLDLFAGEKGRTYKGIFEKGLLYPPEMQPWEREKPESVQGKYISFSDFFYEYAKNNLTDCKLYDEKFFWNTYNKVGLEIDTNLGKAKDEHLYFADMLENESREVSYLVEFELEEEFSECEWKKMTMLGGMTRTAYIEQRKESENQFEIIKDYKNKVNTTDCIKLIFLTPAVMKDKSNFNKSIEVGMNEKGIEILGRVIGKLEQVSGFDMVKQERKDSKMVIPAGSIYYLKNSNWNGKKNIEIQEELSGCLKNILYHSNRHSDKIEDSLTGQETIPYQSNRGFGLFLVAEWSEEE